MNTRGETQSGRARPIGLGAQRHQQGPLEPIQLGLPPPLLGHGHQRQGFRHDGQPGLGLPQGAVRCSTAKHRLDRPRSMG